MLFEQLLASLLYHTSSQFTSLCHCYSTHTCIILNQFISLCLCHSAHSVVTYSPWSSLSHCESAHFSLSLPLSSFSYQTVTNLSITQFTLLLHHHLTHSSITVTLNSLLFHCILAHSTVILSLSWFLSVTLTQFNYLSLNILLNLVITLARSSVSNFLPVQSFVSQSFIISLLSVVLLFSLFLSQLLSSFTC